MGFNEQEYRPGSLWEDAQREAREFQWSDEDLEGLPKVYGVGIGPEGDEEQLLRLDWESPSVCRFTCILPDISKVAARGTALEEAVLWRGFTRFAQDGILENDLSMLPEELSTEKFDADGYPIEGFGKLAFAEGEWRGGMAISVAVDLQRKTTKDVRMFRVAAMNASQVFMNEAEAMIDGETVDYHDRDVHTLVRDLHKVAKVLREKREHDGLVTDNEIRMERKDKVRDQDTLKAQFMVRELMVAASFAAPIWADETTEGMLSEGELKPFLLQKYAANNGGRPMGNASAAFAHLLGENGSDEEVVDAGGYSTYYGRYPGADRVRLTAPNRDGIAFVNLMNAIALYDMAEQLADMSPEEKKGWFSQSLVYTSEEAEEISNWIERARKRERRWVQKQRSALA